MHLTVDFFFCDILFVIIIELLFKKVTKTMILLNQIDESKKNEIINLVRDKSLGIRVVADQECQGLYYQTFRDLKRICKSMKLIKCFKKSGFTYLF